MEYRAADSGGTTSRKSRSLDLQSLYKSTVSVQQGDKKKRTNEVLDDGRIRKKKKKKRKSRREVSVNSLEPAGQTCRISLDDTRGDSTSSDSLNSGKLHSWLSGDFGTITGLSSISLNLDGGGGGNVIQIPKRRRGFVGRKRVESVKVSRLCGNVSGTSADQITKLNGESKRSEEKVLWPLDVSSADGIAKSDDSACKKIVPPKVKGKRVVDVSNVDKTSRVKSARHAKEEDGHVIVNNNGDASSGKSRKSQRKGTDLALGSESLANKVEPLADSSNTVCHNSQDEDEENLEQNAAQMLSSRFDPSFKKVALESRSFASPRRNGVSFVVSTGDIAARTLRPRNHKGKGLFRKRRHFYEILSKDLDAHWVLNRRIKIFWPLDESWYYGLVNEYDSKRDLHHIKYDDRDEEWINLQNERFKLLVFPSEIPRKMETERGSAGNKHDDSRIRDSAAAADSFIGCHTDSEPIISWLARSSRKVKSSLLGVSKRRKTSHPSSNFLPLVLSAKPNDANGCLDMGFSARHMRESSSSAMPDRSIDVSRAKKSMLEGSTSSKDSKAPVVYVRRRFHKKGKVLPNEPDEKKACGSSPRAPVIQGFRAPEVCEVLLGQMDPEGLFWSVNNLGVLNVTIGLVESMGLRFELRSVSVLRYLTADNSWLFRSMVLLYYGTVTITWPKIHLEMLFVDNFIGLRFLSFEGCLKQAIALVFLILTAFYQPNGKYADMQIPVTSIRFKLSSFEDVTKQHAFAFFSFSKVKRSKWLFLDCELRSRCLLTKHLPVSECTYDNIKALEGGCNLMHESSIDGELSALEDWRRKSMRRGITRGAFEEESMNQYSSYTAVKHGKFLPFSFSFSAAPTFFLRLHLKLLMENSVASISLQDHDISYSHEHSDNTGTAIGCTLIQDCFKSVSEITQCDLETAESRRWLLYPKQHLGICSISECNDSGLVKSSQDVQSGNFSTGETSACSRDPAENLCHVVVQSQKLGCSRVESEKHITTPEPLVCKDHVSVGVPDSSRYSSLTGLSVEIPFLDQNEMPSNGKTPNSEESFDLAWNASDATGCNPNPTGPGSIWHHNRESLNSLSRDASPLLANGRRDFICNGFGNGPKKPRTQVHYTLPSGVSEFGAMHKMHTQRGVPYKRIRKASEKRTLPDSRNSQRRNLEFLACDANVLITIGDKGWREYGARIVLELVDHNEWRLAVKLTGTTKYSYKAHQFLQPGSTNRYTHAMMWKGGKDWVLEFPDRSQWILFKEMHEECYNRNMRAASVKNIPIPGVRLIEESDDNGTELPFVRCAPMYFQQVETDIDMAMDPLSILYDMDSDDEQWISENQNSSCNHGSKCEEISEELFERTMDAFEKVAYAEQRDHFTSDEMENFMGGVAPLEVIKLIYDHWRQKRQKKGMPLIRHLQPPLWERYEQQVKEWEHAMAKANSTHPNGCQDKASAMEKPPIFAFCLKPRGLEVPNKGSKQRSHKKFPASGHSHAFLGDHDGLHAFGRRSSGFASVDEKVMFQGNSRESSDASPLFQPSRAFSPRGACGIGYFSLNNDYTDWNHPKLHSNRSKKIGTLLSPSLNSPQTLALYNQRTTIGRRNGVHRWNMGLPEWSNQKHYALEGSLRQSIEHLDGPDLDEFRLRDASGAAHHALTMARLKREKAQRLLYRADLAIHKAVVALTAAEAIKASFSEDSNGIEKEDNMKLE